MAEWMTQDEANFYRTQSELAKNQIISLNKQDKISKEQIKILKQQNKILDKQTNFSETLMLATVVLALGTGLTLLLMTLEFDWGSIVPKMGSFLAIIFGFFFLVYLTIMFVLIWRLLESIRK